MRNRTAKTTVSVLGGLFQLCCPHVEQRVDIVETGTGGSRPPPDVKGKKKRGGGWGLGVGVFVSGG